MDDNIIEAAAAGAQTRGRGLRGNRRSNHVRDGSQRRHKCDICNKEYAYYGSLQNHRARLHPDAEPMNNVLVTREEVSVRYISKLINLMKLKNI